MNMPRWGLLNLYKPVGMSSRQAVDVVQALVYPDKAGHAGTLDPLASGVLVVCVGKATRLISYVQQMSKTYRATFLLGYTSETNDVEGAVLRCPEAPEPSLDELRESLGTFVGEILQTPPAFSAVKVHGRRAYRLAREGRHVELEARRVHVERLQLLRYDYPSFEVEIECGTGTYVRALGRDIARRLGTEAVMEALERIAIGPFRADQACAVDALTSENLAEWLLPPGRAVAHLPSLEFDDPILEHLANGQAVPFEADQVQGEVAVFDRRGELAGIAVVEDGRLRPRRNFPRG